MRPNMSNFQGFETDRPGTSAAPVPAVRGMLTLVIVVGLILRLVYPGTTVFCEDQAHACALAEDIVAGHWQTGGLINSGGFRNLPGFVYALALVWRVWADPLALVLFTGSVNVLAVLASAWLMRRWIGPTAAWWGTAFLSAAPWAIHYSRWIWAQHLLFPAALVVYLFLWRWLVLGRRWSALGVVLGLTVLVQIHLICAALVVAIGLSLVWIRARLPIAPLAVGAAIALTTAVPYLLDGHLGLPEGKRFGYQHFWRVIPGAAMSVSGLGWQLEFRSGYPAFAENLGWRRWPYEIVMLVPALVLASAGLSALRRIWTERSEPKERRRTPIALASVLILSIPLSFDLLALRTSPAYFPLWYPLPFVLMGAQISRFLESRRSSRAKRWISAGLVGVLVAELCFFCEQLRYIHENGGVPHSPIGRSYGGMLADVADVVKRTRAVNIWMTYEGPSVIQDEPAAYLLRHAEWDVAAPESVLIAFRWWGEAIPSAVIEPLSEGMAVPDDAYLIHPWRGPQQYGSEIPMRTAAADSTR